MSFFKISVAAALAVSTISAPLMAQSAAPLSVAGAARSGPALSGANQLDDDEMGGYLLPLGVFAVVILGVIFLIGNTDDDLPASA